MDSSKLLDEDNKSKLSKQQPLENNLEASVNNSSNNGGGDDDEEE
jgi:hypothetical protein